MRFGRTLAVPLLLAVLAGCTPTPPPTAAGTREVPGALGTARTIEHILDAGFDAVAPMPAAAMLPTGSSGGVYLRSTGKPPQRRFEYTVEWASEREWVVAIGDEARAVYQLDGAGNLRVVREEDATQNASVLYDPGLIVLPAGLTTDVVEGESMAVVYDHAGKRKRDAGRITYRVRVVGRAPVATPAGTIDSVVVRMTREMDLGLAEVKIDTVRAWAPGAGVVAEVSDRRVRALGLLSRHSRFVTERAE